MSALAARHPGRVARVIYLDGAYDWADSPAPEGSAEVASPDRFASYEDFVAFVHSVSPDFERLWGPALDAMFRTLVVTHPDGSVTERLSDAEAAPFVEAVHSFRHPYADISAPDASHYLFLDHRDEVLAAMRELLP